MTWHGVEIGSHAPGSDEWLKQVSASKVAAICGASKYDSALSLFWQMTGRVTRDTADTGATRRGRRLEAAVIDEVIDAYPGLVLERGANFHHPDHVWWTAAPDAHSVTDSLIVEAKTATTGNAWKWGETFAEAPVAYQFQVAGQLLVTGADRAILGLLYSDFNAFEFRHFEVERDALTIHHEGRAYRLQDVEDAVMEFKACLDFDEQPAWDGSDATYQAVREINTDVEDGQTVIPDDLAYSYAEASHYRKLWEEAETRFKSEIMALAKGTRTILAASGFKIGSRQKRGKAVSFIPNPKLNNFYQTYREDLAA